MRCHHWAVGWIERKQKRPQGHCDIRRMPRSSDSPEVLRENKNARKGIATRIQKPDKLGE